MRGTPNDDANVVYSTLRVDSKLDLALREAIESAVLGQHGTVAWGPSRGPEPTYALVETPDESGRNALRAVPSITTYDKSVIALAVFPELAEALRPVREALTGAGRPIGVLGVYEVAGGVVVEWDPAVTAASVVLGAVDVELRRFQSARRCELLSPLPPAVVASIAATGLGAPQIVPEKILELRIGRG